MFSYPITKRLITDQFAQSQQNTETLTEPAEDTPTNAENTAQPPPPQHPLQKMPQTIQGKIVEIDTIQISDDIVKRFKFLSHLPNGTTIQLIELNFSSIKAIEYQDSNQTTIKSEKRIIFDKDVLNKIRPALNKRKAARNKRLKDEKNYQRVVEQNERFSNLEELFYYSEHDFLPIQNNNPEFFNQPLEFEDIEGYDDMFNLNEGEEPEDGTETGSVTTTSTLNLRDQNLQKLKSQPVKTFGLAKKMAKPLSDNINEPKQSFGFAARFRNLENQPTEEEMAYQILGQNPEILANKLTPKTRLPKSHEDIIEPCFVSIKSKNNKKNNKKGGKKKHKSVKD